jgi:hypothetical protein
MDARGKMNSAPREESQRRAAWVLARALEGGDTVANVLWLASQLEVIENDWRAVAATLSDAVSSAANEQTSKPLG